MEKINEADLSWNFHLKPILCEQNILNVWIIAAYNAIVCVKIEMPVYLEKCLLATHSIAGFCNLITISLFTKAGDESALNRSLTITQPVSCDLLKRVRENS